MNKDVCNQYYNDGENFWSVSRLIELSKGLEVFELPLRCLNYYNLYPKSNSTKEFINNVKLVNDADLDCPIILDEEGYVMDGRHRIMKALLEERESIKAVRFDVTPYRCFVENKD